MSGTKIVVHEDHYTVERGSATLTSQEYATEAGALRGARAFAESIGQEPVHVEYEKDGETQRELVFDPSAKKGASGKSGSSAREYQDAPGPTPPRESLQEKLGKQRRAAEERGYQGSNSPYAG